MNARAAEEPSERTDLLVVGAGPAGSTAATLAARAGYDVTIVDACAFPRDKACGEGIMPGGVDLLARFGLAEAVAAADPAPFHAIRFDFGSQDPILLPVHGNQDRKGWAIARDRLDAALLAAAAAAGARILTGTRLDSFDRGPGGVKASLLHNSNAHVLQARAIILATGLPTAACPPAPRIGLTAHIPAGSAPDAGGRVDVFVRPGLEIYSSSVGNGERVVALLASTRGRHIASGDGLQARYASLTSAPDLPAWLRTAPTRLRGAALHADPLARPLPYQDGSGLVLRAGNALVATDPVAAQGMTIALRSGGEAALSILEGWERGEDERAIVARYRARISPWLNRSRLIARALRELVEHPSMGRPILARLAAQGPSSALVNDAAAATLPRSTGRTVRDLLGILVNRPIPASR